MASSGRRTNCVTDHSRHIYKDTFSHEGQRVADPAQFVKAMSGQFNNSHFNDLTLHVNGKTFAAHRLILGAQSEIFYIMLSDVRWSDQRRSTITLNEEDVCVFVFEEFLKFFYGNSIDLDHQNVLPLLMLADKYQVKNLQLVCVDYMVSHLAATFQLKQIFSWHHYASLTGYKVLARTIFDFIRCNFCNLGQSNDYYCMDYGLLLRLLQMSELVVPNEYSLFTTVVDWINEQENFQESECHLSAEQICKLLNEVRFPMMSLEELCTLHDLDLVEQHEEFFINAIDLAMKFHCSGFEECSAMACFKSRKYLIEPRIYTDWSYDVECNYSTLGDHSSSLMEFRTPLSNSEVDKTKLYQWSLQSFPKGIYHGRFMMMALFRKIHISSHTEKVFRLILKRSHDFNVQIGLHLALIAETDGTEYVKKSVSKVLTFEELSIHTLDDVIISYHDLKANRNPEYFVGENHTIIHIKMLIYIKQIK